MSSDSDETGQCTAHNKETNEECTCDEFRSSSDKPTKCLSCSHSLKHHLVEKPRSQKRSSQVDALLAGILSKGNSKGAISSSNVGSSKASSSKATGGGSKPWGNLSFSKKSLLAANDEAKEGMRGQRKPKSSRKGKGKAKAGIDFFFIAIDENSDNHGSDDEGNNDTFKVESVQVLPYGVAAVQDDSKAPDGVDLQEAKMRGLAVFDVKGIKFNQNASHEGVMDRLSELLPGPFAYLRRRREESSDKGSTWCLAVKRQRKLAIIPIPFPTGMTLYFNKGPRSAGFKNHRIIIVTREPIPDDILQQWVDTEAVSFSQTLTASGHKSSGDIPEVAESDDDFPEYIPLPNRGRLFSQMSDTEQLVPVKKRKTDRKWSRGSTVDSLSESSIKETIDLTEDEELGHVSAASAPDNLSNGPSNVDNEPAITSPGRTKVVDDPTLGDPYDKSITFSFF